MTRRNITAATVPNPQLAMYGPGIGGDALANTRLGGPVNTTKIFNRFRAEQSLQLTSFRFYLIGVATGYGAGTGGVWTASIFNDDGSANHFPAGDALAVQQVAAQTPSDAGRIITFSNPATLVAGTLYHLVYENIDASPTQNYFSPDYWFYMEFPNGAFEGRLNPRFPTTDWSHGYKITTDSTWTLRPSYAPILELIYADGSSQGMSYGEASYAAGQVGKITGTNMVRENFTVSNGTFTCSFLGFRILRDQATGSGALTIYIADGSGNVLKNLSVPGANITAGPAFDPAGSDAVKLGAAAKWYEVSLGGSMTFQDGASYRLRFVSTTSTTYWAWVNRHLNSYGYLATTYFSDGEAQKSSDGTSWSSLGRVAGQNDLQFYFR